jgi:hypothetical protein
MKEGDWGAHDDSTTYWDEGWQKMVPIPAGYTAPSYGAPDDDEDKLGCFMDRLNSAYGQSIV